MNDSRHILKLKLRRTHFTSVKYNYENSVQYYTYEALFEVLGSI